MGQTFLTYLVAGFAFAIGFWTVKWLLDKVLK